MLVRNPPSDKICLRLGHLIRKRAEKDIVRYYCIGKGFQKKLLLQSHRNENLLDTGKETKEERIPSSYKEFLPIKIKAPFEGKKFHQLPVLKLRQSELKLTCPRSVNGLIKSSGLLVPSPESYLSAHTVYICTRRKNNRVIFAINLF